MATGLPFLFTSQSDASPQGRIVRVPAEIASRAALFDVFEQQAELPGYFGRNWDALSECLRDLSWIGEERLVIVHEGLPQLAEKELQGYLHVLNDSVSEWSARRTNRLIVMFPSRDQERIKTLMYVG